ncbi:MAG: BMC domain-containing protein [Chlorobi bacterium]|nr:BMC domain-containing protein [Chlorobiota bacterium]
MLLALGLIETRGLIGAIEAADAMLKASNVKLVGKEKSTAALITIKIVGEVAAVRSAVDAGAAAAQKVGELLSTHVIPRPSEEIESLIYRNDQVIAGKGSGGRRGGGRRKKERENLPSLFDKSEIEEKPERTSENPSETIEVNEDDFSEEFRDTEMDVSEEEYSEDDVSERTEKVEEVFSEDQTAEDEISQKEDASESKSKFAFKMEELEILNVHQLRRKARAIEDFPIKGRDISKANRGLLLDYFKSLL